MTPTDMLAHGCAPAFGPYTAITVGAACADARRQAPQSSNLGMLVDDALMSELCESESGKKMS